MPCLRSPDSISTTSARLLLICTQPDSTLCSSPFLYDSLGATSTCTLYARIFSTYVRILRLGRTMRGSLGRLYWVYILWVGFKLGRHDVSVVDQCMICTGIHSRYYTERDRGARGASTGSLCRLCKFHRRGLHRLREPETPGWPRPARCLSFEVRTLMSSISYRMQRVRRHVCGASGHRMRRGVREPRRRRGMALLLQWRRSVTMSLCEIMHRSTLTSLEAGIHGATLFLLGWLWHACSTSRSRVSDDSSANVKRDSRCDSYDPTSPSLRTNGR